MNSGLRDPANEGLDRRGTSFGITPENFSDITYSFTKTEAIDCTYCCTEENIASGDTLS